MPQFSRLTAIVLTLGTVLASAGSALAGVGQPTPWQLGLQDASSPVMVDIVWFHDFLVWIISAIALFVLVLLAIVVLRFNARANPTPSRTTHNSLLEVAWTIVPVVNTCTIVPVEVSISAFASALNCLLSSTCRK